MGHVWSIPLSLALAAVFTLYLTPVMYKLLALLAKARAAETRRLSEELEDSIEIKDQATAN